MTRRSPLGGLLLSTAVLLAAEGAAVAEATTAPPPRTGSGDTGMAQPPPATPDYGLTRPAPSVDPNMPKAAPAAPSSEAFEGKPRGDARCPRGEVTDPKGSCMRPNLPPRTRPGVGDATPRPAH